MFPKNTIATTVAVPPEKPTQEKKESAVLYMVDGVDQRVDNQYSRWQFRRATICACAVVMTTLILVAGALGALAIVFRARQVRFNEPFVPKERLYGHESDNNSPLEVPYSHPPIKIDDGGLWPPRHDVTPDFVAVDTTEEGEVHFASPKPDSVVVDPVPEIDPSSFRSSSDEESSSYYERPGQRTYISSSFPYDGYYMRGGEGDPPPSMESSEGRWLGSSGDGDQEGSGAAEVVYRDIMSSDVSSPQDTSSSSSSYSDPYIVSE